MSKKLLDFKTDPARYEANATIVWCLDDRFSEALEAFAKHEGMNHRDVVKCVGGAKALVRPDSEEEKITLLRQINASIKLHRPKKIVLMIHSDCGAYGGLRAFNDDPEAEREYQEEQLRRAKQILEMNIPVPVEAVFVGFDGIYEIE